MLALIIPNDVLTVPKQKGCSFVLGNSNCVSYCRGGYILVSLNGNLWSWVKRLQAVSSVGRDESAEAAFWKVTSGAGLETSLPQAVMLPNGLGRML